MLYFKRGVGWVEELYHSDLLEVVDERSPGNLEEWCKYEIKAKNGIDAKGEWVEEWPGYRKLGFEQAEKQCALHHSIEHIKAHWYGRIVLIDKDRFCK